MGNNQGGKWKTDGNIWEANGSHIENKWEANGKQMGDKKLKTK